MSERTGTADRGWFSFLCDNCQGSSGHGGNLAGMRRLYWGREALVIRCAGFLFRVSPEVFQRVTNRLPAPVVPAT